MEASEGVFEDWYASFWEDDDPNVKEVLRDAFDAGFVSGATFVRTYADEMIKDYEGFQDEPTQQ